MEGTAKAANVTMNVYSKGVRREVWEKTNVCMKKLNTTK